MAEEKPVQLGRKKKKGWVKWRVTAYKSGIAPTLTFWGPKNLQEGQTMQIPGESYTVYAIDVVTVNGRVRTVRAYAC